MAKVGDILKRAREAKEMTQEQLAQASGVSKNTISNIETQHRAAASTLLRVARAMGFELWGDVLQQFGDRAQAKTDADVPLLADVPAGFNGDSTTFGGYGVEEPRAWMPRLPEQVEHRNDHRLFALTVVGDSMSPFYRDGDIIVCSPQAWTNHGFEDGKRYAVRFTEEAGGGTTVKRVRLIGEHEIDLIPENDRHPVRRITHEQVKLAARVIARYVTE